MSRIRRRSAKSRSRYGNIPLSSEKQIKIKIRMEKLLIVISHSLEKIVTLQLKRLSIIRREKFIQFVKQ